MILDITENVRKMMDNSANLLLLMLDLSKAFDSLCHGILCHKLQSNFLFDSSACSLIRSYLENRHQYVEFAWRRSVTLRTFRGVPQGSILGPL